MEGVQRAKHAFMHFWITKKLSDISCGCFKKDLQNLKFKQQWLRASLSVEPELMLWQNYGVSKYQRCFRTLIFTICMLGLLSASLYSVLYFEKLCYDKE
jgi:hypothetical protein